MSELEKLDKKRDTLKSNIETEIDKMNEATINAMSADIIKSVENIRSSSITSKLEKAQKKIEAFSEKIKTYENDINTFESELNSFYNSVDSKSANEQIADYGAGTVDKLDEIKEKIKKENANTIKDMRDKLKNSKEIYEKYWEALKNCINSKTNEHVTLNFVQKEVSLFKSIVDGYDTVPVAVRNEIDNLRKKIKKDIDYVEQKQREENKDLTKINECRKEFDEACSSLKKKTGLKIKSVKSAKDFFKKHKKAILITTGLIVLATTIVDLSMGLGPLGAIMRGNIWLASKSGPALKPVFKFFNDVIGKLAGASKSSVGVWRSAVSNTIINPGAVSGQILKGLALVGLNTATLGLKAGLLVGLIKKLRKSKVDKQDPVKNREKNKDNNNENKTPKKKTTKKKPQNPQPTIPQNPNPQPANPQPSNPQKPQPTVPQPLSNDFFAEELIKLAKSNEIDNYFKNLILNEGYLTMHGDIDKIVKNYCKSSKKFGKTDIGLTVKTFYDIVKDFIFRVYDDTTENVNKTEELVTSWKVSETYKEQLLKVISDLYDKCNEYRKKRTGGSR